MGAAQMKHRGPGLLDGAAVSSRPMERRVVANVPASLHGSVTSDGPGEPILAPRCLPGPAALWRRRCWCKECCALRGPPAARQSSAPGPWRKSLSLTSEIYTPPFGTRSLLQLANATVVLENGTGLSRAIRTLPWPG